MPPVFKFGCQKHPQAILGHFFTDDPFSQNQDIGVIVLTREPCRQSVMTERRPNAGMPVDGDAHADAASADQHASGRFILQPFISKCIGVIWIVP